MFTLSMRIHVICIVEKSGDIKVGDQLCQLNQFKSCDWNYSGITKLMRGHLKMHWKWIPPLSLTV